MEMTRVTTPTTKVVGFLAKDIVKIVLGGDDDDTR